MSLYLAWWRVAAVAVLATQAMAQQCYYPNGNKAPDTEKACSSAKGSACCPENWECLDNGLCHYPPDNLYGRYSLSLLMEPSEYRSPVLDLKAGGGESITQCSNHGDQWCCNADGVHVNCCQESPAPRPFFALQNPAAYATIGSMTASTAPILASITGEATGGGSGNQPSTSLTPAPQSSDARSSPNSPQSASPSPSSNSLSPSSIRDSSASAANPFTSVFFSASSGSTGIVSVPITSVITPTSDVTTQSNNGNKGDGSDSNLGLIIGCAVGIPLGLALVGSILWLLRRRQRKPNPYGTANVDDDTTNLAGGTAGKLNKEQAFRHSGPPAGELDGNPVGAGRPISTVLGHAELESGNGFNPGHSTPYAPDAVGIGGGNVHPDRTTWDSVPPQYSPGQHHVPYRYPEMSELADTSVAPVFNEKGDEHAGHGGPQSATGTPTVTAPAEHVQHHVQR
ncbi:uncharacterized protein yc1106_06314 [Curvularia clavata]|uniref:Uncharacterized protein n=1 Tax=Curvularia clavata TaxID=95742 RepID=A0A9Q8ZC73_CURCL|nr:uncharacterized protein yc1106_06314 [Curvularia clavata]